MDFGRAVHNLFGLKKGVSRIQVVHFATSSKLRKDAAEKPTSYFANLLFDIAAPGSKKARHIFAFRGSHAGIDSSIAFANEGGDEEIRKVPKRLFVRLLRHLLKRQALHANCALISGVGNTSLFLNLNCEPRRFSAVGELSAMRHNCGAICGQQEQK